jgi:zinc and cadmium transporter
MTLILILLGTVAAGVGSVWVAAVLSFAMLARYTAHMLSLAAGALLATAFMHLLPEAFESAAGAHDLFALLLGGLVFFFLLDKAELYHHGHEHSHATHDPAHHHGHRHHHADSGPHHVQAVRMGGGWAVLAGDSVHAFGDGILIASAFLADWKLGLVTALAVLAHEVPHHMGDLVVLQHTVGTRRAALLKVSLAGTVTAIGGVVGYFLVSELADHLPYFLVVASSSFVYVALADLIPQLQKRLNLAETLAQLVWLLTGMAMVTVVSGLAH